MDPKAAGMDYSDSSEEELTLRRKFARSPSLSTIAEETPRTSRSSSSTGSGRFNLDSNMKSKIFSVKRRLFDSKESGMDVDLSSSGYSDLSSPTTNQKQKLKTAELKKKAFDPNLEKASCSKAAQTKRKPMKEQNQPGAAKKRPLKTEDSCKDLGKTKIPKEEVSYAFDKLFVCGIFNTVKPSTPTAEELRTMYINNSSDDDEQAKPKKRKKLAPLTKKKVQSKLTFKKTKNVRTFPNDSESDSDF